MIAITTNSSISVNAERAFETYRMLHPRSMTPGAMSSAGIGRTRFPVGGRQSSRTRRRCCERSPRHVGEPAERFVDRPDKRPVQFIVHGGEFHLPLRAEPP